MASPTDHPQTAAERLIVRTIAATWLLWALGALYIAGPALGWILGLMGAWRLYLHGGRISGLVTVWLVGMTAMLVVLWIGHAAFALGTAQTVKSSIGWAKGWALLALFIFAGATLDIREAVVVRAICRLGVQTLVLLPIFLLAPLIGLPGTLYTSPLQAVGGPGPEYFSTILYTIDPESGAPRWQFFAPWSPAAGMVAVIHALAAAREQHRGWRAVGCAAALLMALLSASRLALVAIVAVPVIVMVISRANRASTVFLGAAGALLVGFLGPALLALVEGAMADFASARAGSSRVRATLGRIALERWQGEAFWAGHGIVERGPHIVEYMPIGSHHSWYGLLFVKGLLGALALAIPMAVSLAWLGWQARHSASHRCGLAMMLTLLLYSFGENLEILAYLFWPALILVGIAFKPAAPHPSRSEAS